MYISDSGFREINQHKKIRFTINIRKVVENPKLDLISKQKRPITC